MLMLVGDGWVGPDGTPWALPGTGGQGHGCGTHIGTAQECLGCQHHWAILTSCKAWVCLGCAPSKVRTQAMATAIRADGIRGALAAPDGLVFTRRAVLSPPPERWEALRRVQNGHHLMTGLRRQAWDLAQSKGFLGGVLVFHPWRDRQTWRFRHWGPHFHIIGPAAWLGEGDTARDGGWFFQARAGPMRLGAVYDRLAYDLTHVGVVPGKPVVTYHGAVHPNHRRGALLDQATKGRIAGLEGGRVHVCPQCASTNTRAYLPTWEELEAWGVIRPLERAERAQWAQAALKCDDCGGLALEPVPEPAPRWARPVNPWREGPDRAPMTRGSHWDP